MFVNLGLLISFIGFQLAEAREEWSSSEEQSSLDVSGSLSVLDLMIVCLCVCVMCLP